MEDKHDLTSADIKNMLDELADISQDDIVTKLERALEARRRLAEDAEAFIEYLFPFHLTKQEEKRALVLDFLMSNDYDLVKDIEEADRNELKQKLLLKGGATQRFWNYFQPTSAPAHAAEVKQVDGEMSVESRTHPQAEMNWIPTCFGEPDLNSHSTLISVLSQLPIDFSNKGVGSFITSDPKGFRASWAACCGAARRAAAKRESGCGW